MLPSETSWWDKIVVEFRVRYFSINLVQTYM